MSFAAWFTLAVVAAIMALLVLTNLAADAVFVAALAVLLLTGVLDPPAALSGFSNEGMITVAVLYGVVAGLRDTGGIHWIVQVVLGRPRSLPHAQWRLMAPVLALSAVLNNTPVVSMLVPAVADWAKKYRLSVSKLMMPLSFAAILGGVCTLIGTSTNLVVNGLLIERGTGLGMFSIAVVGVPIALAGLAFILLTSRWLLPDRIPVLDRLTDPRQYSTEMIVEAGGPLVGKTIEEAGLRALPQSFLAEIERRGELLPAVAPTRRLEAEDRLLFVGVVDAMVELQRIRGLAPATDQVGKLDGRRDGRSLIEAVVAPDCPVTGLSIREGQFRTRYNAVVIAVARSGHRLKQKIGDIVLRPGDTLLLETRPSFLEQHRNSRDFYLVSAVDDSAPLRHERAPLALLILLGMVAAAASGLLSMLQAALVALLAMMLAGCSRPESVRRAIDWPVLIVIGAAFGVAAALEQTGAAASVAAWSMGLIGPHPLASLAMLYVLTVLFSLVITNNAAALLMFPFAEAVSADLGVSLLPFAIVIMMAASAAFATPIGYQTNLMVYGPGGYRFMDYVRLGLPLTLLTGVIALLLIPRFWPF